MKLKKFVLLCAGVFLVGLTHLPNTVNATSTQCPTKSPTKTGRRPRRSVVKIVPAKASQMLRELLKNNDIVPDSPLIETPQNQ